jgi:hypothetical protein
VIKLSDCFFMLPNYTNLRLFRAGIKPMWEDEANRTGGRWAVQCNKKDSSLVWLSALMAMLVGDLSYADDICGCCLNVRSVGDTVQLWNRSADLATRQQDAWREQLLAALGLSRKYEQKLVYHPHAVSVTYNRAFSDTAENTASFGFYDSVQQRRKARETAGLSPSSTPRSSAGFTTDEGRDDPSGGAIIVVDDGVADSLATQSQGARAPAASSPQQQQQHATTTTAGSATAAAAVAATSPLLANAAVARGRRQSCDATAANAGGPLFRHSARAGNRPQDQDSFTV